MFAAVPSPALGVNFDPSHLVRLGIDYLRVLDEFKARIYHFHGKDTALLPEAQYRFGHLPPALERLGVVLGGAWRYCVPGDGAVNWGQVAYGLFGRLRRLRGHRAGGRRYWGTLRRSRNSRGPRAPGASVRVTEA